MGTTSKKARILIACVLALGGVILLLAFTHWNSDNLPRFVCYVALTLLSSGMKVRLPGITGSMSVAFLFALIGIEQLTISENLLMVGAATVLQCIWHAENRPKPIQVLFNVGSIAIAVYLSTLFYDSGLFVGYPFAPQLRMVVTAAAYFVLNTFPVAAVIAFTENRPLGTIWHELYLGPSLLPRRRRHRLWSRCSRPGIWLELHRAASARDVSDSSCLWDLSGSPVDRTATC